MASLIKKQILKHLSKFTKNLSADSINLSTFKGEGELSNLELDCDALQNLVNLPTWLQLTRATCNKVSVKIPWTTLKKSPIKIFLDTVEVEMITCEKPRAPNGPSPIQSSSSSGDSNYGYTVKVLEGISLYINSIAINFKSTAFSANFQLSQLSVESTNPQWQHCDLRYTRIEDTTIGQVLSFKQVSWQTMRIVADAIKTNDKANLTPIRLITNQTRLRLTLRRQTSDCDVIASKLSFELDDLLWVLTDSQVRAALLCVKSLTDAIEKSDQQKRDLMDTGAVQIPNNVKPQSVPTDANTISLKKLFAQHSILESSFHIDLDRVDLHICEDGTMFNNIDCERIVEGGAIQMTLYKVKIDHYPLHKADGQRKHFRDYGETMEHRNRWATDIIRKFRQDFSSLKKAAANAGNLIYAHQDRKPAKLSESCFSVRVEDIDMYQVSASTSKKSVTAKLLTSNRKQLLLPEDMPLLHMIQTEYYYPDGRDYPAPHNNLFMQVNAPHINIDWTSLLWLNQLSLVTVDAVQTMLEDLGLMQQQEDEFEQELNIQTSTPEEHTDIRIQLLMPNVYIPGPESDDPERPVGIEVHVSQATVTNCREGVDCSRGHLNLALENLQKTFIANHPYNFPHENGIDLAFAHDMFRCHADGEDLPIRRAISSGDAKMNNKALKCEASKDVWSISVEQVWLDFVLGTKSREEESLNEDNIGGFLKKDPSESESRKVPIPFVDSFPIIMWVTDTPHTSFDVELQTSGTDGKNLASKSTTSNTTSAIIENIAHDCSLENKQKPIECCPLSPVSSEGSPKLIRNPKLMQYYSTVPNKPDGDAASQSSCVQSTSSTGSKIRYKSTATYVLAHTEKPIRLQLDHTQFMFIMRLLDDVEKVGKRLQNDTNSIMQSNVVSPTHSAKIRMKATSGPATAIRIFTTNADLFLVLREIPEAKKFEKIETEQTESKVSNKSNEAIEPKQVSLFKKKPLPSPPNSETGSDTISIFGDTSSNTGDGILDSTPVSLSKPSPICVNNNNQTNYKDVKADNTPHRSDSFSIHNSSVVRTNDNLVRNFSTGNLNISSSKVGRASPGMQMVDTAASNTSLESKSSGYETNTRETTPTLGSSNQKTFGPNFAQILDNDSASMSSHSSLDEFVMIQVNNESKNDGIKFLNSSINKPVLPDSVSITSETSVRTSLTTEQTQSEHMLDSQMTVTNRSMSSLSADSSHELTQQEPIKSTSDVSVNTTMEVPKEKCSLLHLRIFDGLVIAVDSHESTDNIVKLSVANIEINQLGNILKENIQSIFTTYKCKTTPLLYKMTETPVISLRIDQGPHASKLSPIAPEMGYMRMSANNLKQIIKSSTLTNIGSFFEDEVEAKVMPMEIVANNLTIEIADDMPAIYKTTVPGPPITLQVHEAVVKRTDDGVFNINMSTTSSSEKINKDSVPNANDEVVTPTNTDTVNEKGDEAKKINNDLLVRIKNVSTERDALKMSLESLQEQLVASENARQKLLDEVRDLQSICEMLQSQTK